MDITDYAKKIVAVAAIAAVTTLGFNKDAKAQQYSEKLQNEVSRLSGNKSSFDRQFPSMKIFGPSGVEIGMNITNVNYENEYSRNRTESYVQGWLSGRTGNSTINSVGAGYSFLNDGKTGGSLQSLDLHYGFAYAKENFALLGAANTTFNGVEDENFGFANLSLQAATKFRNFMIGVKADVEKVGGLGFLTLLGSYTNDRKDLTFNASIMKSVSHEGTDSKPNTVYSVGIDYQVSRYPIDAWNVFGSLAMVDKIHYNIDDYNAGGIERGNRIQKHDLQNMLELSAGVRKYLAKNTVALQVEGYWGDVTRRTSLYEGDKRIDRGVRANARIYFNRR